jgi:hypothetical protein
MVSPQQLVEKGVCVSFAEARRLISGLSEQRLEKIIQEKQMKWGRSPKRVKRVLYEDNQW